MSPVEGPLGRRHLGVVRAPRVPYADSLEHRRAVAEPVDVVDVRSVLVPEDELRVLAEPTDPIVERARRHGAAATRRTFEDRNAVQLASNVGLTFLAQVLDVLRR